MICVALTYTVKPTRTTLQLVVSYRDTECYAARILRFQQLSSISYPGGYPAPNCYGADG